MPPVIIGAVALGGAAIAAGGVMAAFAAGGFIAFAANFGASMLLSAAAQALAPAPSLPQVELRPRTVTVREPVKPRDWVYGRARKGGVIVFLHSSGTREEVLHLVIVLAAHPVKSIGAIYFEGEEAVTAQGVAQGRWSGKVAVEKRLGAADQTAFDGLRTALPEYWTEAHRLAGCAALYLALSYDADAFPGGIPNITADLEGKTDIFDPRTGSTGYSENAALCVADYMADARVGLGAAPGAEDGVSEASLIEAANICDEEVAVVGGGTEPRYACNGMVSLDQTPKAIIEALLTAMAGRAVWQGGAWHIQAGAYRPPGVTLTEADIRAGGLQLTTRVSRAQLFNGVRGTFVSPENDWQPDDFPAYVSETYRAEDGGEEIWRDIALPFTISPSTAQRLARIELERVRRQMSLRLEGQLSAWRAVVGDCVRLDYARWGFAAKPFEVQGVSLGLESQGEAPLLVPEITLRETSPAIYDWDATEGQIYAAAPRTTLPSAFQLAAPGTPQISEALYITRDGGGVKLLVRVTWEAAESGFVVAYQLEARRDGGPWIVQGRTDGLSMEILDIAAGVWEMRVKALSALGVSSEWRLNSAELLGLKVPPVALEGLTLQSAGGIAILKWQRSADADVRVGGAVLIRHSKDGGGWANSVQMDRVSGGEAIAVVPLKPGTYLIRAEDSEGRLGPVTSVTTKGVQLLSFAQLNTLQADPDFPGQKTNLTVSGGALTLLTGTDANGVPYVAEPEGLYHFAERLDFGALRRVRLRSEIVVAADALLDEIDARLSPVDSWADFDGAEGAEVDVVVEIRETEDDPTGSPTWGPWGRLDMSEVEAWGVEARAWIRTEDSAFGAYVTELRITADEVSP